MNLRRFPFSAAIVACLVFSLLAVQVLAWQEKPVSAPIRIESFIKPEEMLRAYVARIDLTDPTLAVRVLPGGAKLEPKSRFPTQLETVKAVMDREKLLFAVNGDFFSVAPPATTGPMADPKRYIVGRPAFPQGHAVTDGVVWHRTEKELPVLLIDAEGQVVLKNIRAIPQGARQVISGNHMLVWNGKALIEHDEAETRHPRTAVGITADGKTLIVVVVDGRSITARGMTLGELAGFMLAQGADDALNLDGGGSTTMIHRDPDGSKVINSPSDGSLRPVVNVLGVERKSR